MDLYEFLSFLVSIDLARLRDRKFQQFSTILSIFANFFRNVAKVANLYAESGQILKIFKNNSKFEL